MHILSISLSNRHADPKDVPSVQLRLGFSRGGQITLRAPGLLRDRFTGYVYTADEWLHIGALPGSDPRAPASKVVVYRAADRRPASGPGCGAALGEDDRGPGAGVQRLSLLPYEKAPAPQEAIVEVAHEVDGDYVDFWGGVTFTLWQLEDRRDYSRGRPVPWRSSW